MYGLFEQYYVESVLSLEEGFFDKFKNNKKKKNNDKEDDITKAKRICEKTLNFLKDPHTLSGVSGLEILGCIDIFCSDGQYPISKFLKYINPKLKSISVMDLVDTNKICLTAIYQDMDNVTDEEKEKTLSKIYSKFKPTDKISIIFDSTSSKETEDADNIIYAIYNEKLICINNGYKRYQVYEDTEFDLYGYGLNDSQNMVDIINNEYYNKFKNIIR